LIINKSSRGLNVHENPFYGHRIKRPQKKNKFIRLEIRYLNSL